MFTSIISGQLDEELVGLMQCPAGDQPHQPDYSATAGHCGQVPKYVVELQDQHPGNILAIKCKTDRELFSLVKSLASRHRLLHIPSSTRIIRL